MSAIDHLAEVSAAATVEQSQDMYSRAGLAQLCQRHSASMAAGGIPVIAGNSRVPAPPTIALHSFVTAKLLRRSQLPATEERPAARERRDQPHLPSPLCPLAPPSAEGSSQARAA